MTDETAVMQGLWPQVLAAAKKRRRFTWILLSQNVTGFLYDGAVLTLAWVDQGAADNFDSSGSISVLEEALEEVLSRPAAVESVLDNAPPAPPVLSPATPLHLPAAASALPSQPDASAAFTLHRALGQTAFLMHERGDNLAAALLAEVGDVELLCSSRFSEQVHAILIVPSSLVPQFTDEVFAAIEPVFVHVAGRHGLQVNRVRAAAALPEIGEDWRQVLQTKLAAADEDTAPAQVPQTPPKEASSRPGRKEAVEGQASGCARRAKTTGGRCRRPAAEWPAHDDLPPPVAACFGHLTPEEQKACQQARDRAREEYNARWKAEVAARQARGVDLKPLTFTPRPCIGQCISLDQVGGSDSDGASMSCANCDNWVCVSCGKAQVDSVLEFCGACSEREAQCDPEPEWGGQYDSGPDTDPNPRARLTVMVNDLVKATGITHREVNASLNRRIGVPSRVGAEEQVIRRAAGAARAWLDELGSPG
ncbi:hypothetical protein EQG64_34150 [Streptomyces sp. S6]|nr:hypothetical protein EQG64_34150 [Streptomyces sp. S6]